MALEPVWQNVRGNRSQTHSSEYESLSLSAFDTTSADVHVDNPYLVAFYDDSVNKEVVYFVEGESSPYSLTNAIVSSGGIESTSTNSERNFGTRFSLSNDAKKLAITPNPSDSSPNEIIIIDTENYDSLDIATTIPLDGTGGNPNVSGIYYSNIVVDENNNGYILGVNGTVLTLISFSFDGTVNQSVDIDVGTTLEEEGSSLTITSENRFLYATTSTSSDIYAYKFDLGDITFTPLGGTPFSHSGRYRIQGRSAVYTGTNSITDPNYLTILATTTGVGSTSLIKISDSANSYTSVVSSSSAYRLYHSGMAISQATKQVYVSYRTGGFDGVVRAYDLETDNLDWLISDSDVVADAGLYGIIAGDPVIDNNDNVLVYGGDNSGFDLHVLRYDTSTNPPTFEEKGTAYNTFFSFTTILGASGLTYYLADQANVLVALGTWNNTDVNSSSSSSASSMSSSSSSEPVVDIPSTSSSSESVEETAATITATLKYVNTNFFEIINGEVYQVNQSNASDSEETRGTSSAKSPSFGIIAAGAASNTMVLNLNVPNSEAIGNIKLGLVSTGSIPFSDTTFGITTRPKLRADVTPETYFQGVNTEQSPDSTYNISIPNRTTKYSEYVYLTIKMPSDIFLESGTIQFRWFFDYAS